MVIALRGSSAEVQSVLDQSGVGRGGNNAAVAKVIRIGTWSDPVDSKGVSHLVRNSVREAEAKARSRTDGLPIPLRGNLV